jgi:4-diphosphocytidyl-2-C-methyl-D-erythritol kinase
LHPQALFRLPEKGLSSARTLPAVMSLHRIAAAKLNLTLRITGRRVDGYHLLDSLVAFTELGDGVTVAAADSLSLDITGEFAPGLTDGADNLILRAARALDPVRGARITLEKRLPVASGIGGGSADAAATLLLLNDLWQLGRSPADLAGLALTLGADVPVCLHRAPTRMGGIGEKLAPGPSLPPAALVLVNPRLACPTPRVFALRQGDFSLPQVGLPDRIGDAAELAALVRRGGNDLTQAAGLVVPAIGSILKALGEEAGCLAAALSGSGATCFGVFAEEAAAVQAAARLKTRHPHWWVANTRIFA